YSARAMAGGREVSCAQPAASASVQTADLQVMGSLERLLRGRSSSRCATAVSRACGRMLAWKSRTEDIACLVRGNGRLRSQLVKRLTCGTSIGERCVQHGGA